MKLEMFTTTKKMIANSYFAMGCITAILLFITISSATAQSMTCNKNVQVSLDNTCSVVVTPGMLMESDSIAGATYEVVIKGKNDIPINPLDKDFISGNFYHGKTLKGQVSAYTANGVFINKCWSSIKVEDKLPPVFDCPNDTVVICNGGNRTFPFPYVVDGCDGFNIQKDIVSDLTVDMNCSQEYSAVREIVYQAKDQKGNTSYCTRRILFERVGLYDVRFPANRDDIEAPALESCIDQIQDIDEKAGKPYAVFARLYKTDVNGTPLGNGSTELVSIAGVNTPNGMSDIDFLRGYRKIQEKLDSTKVDTFYTLTKLPNIPVLDSIQLTGDSTFFNIPPVGYTNAFNYVGNTVLNGLNGDLVYVYRDTSHVYSYYRIYQEQTAYFDSLGLNVLNTPNNRLPNGLLTQTYFNNHFVSIDTTHLSHNKFCEINITPSDDTLNICPGSFKILRKWTVLDWCTSLTREEYQIIKILDTRLIVTQPALGDLVNNNAIPVTDAYDCFALWKVSPPTVLSECNDLWTYSVKSKSSLYGDLNIPSDVYFTSERNRIINGELYIELPAGRNWIRYEVTDACGNNDTTSIEIDVIDKTPPIPVCDEHTVVTLTTAGEARINAETFDDGSHDNCSDVTFKVRRMDNACPGHLEEDDAGKWFDYVHFCCADVTRNPVMVILQVTDAAGNTNTCMVEVRVDNKIVPIITCAAPDTISCQDYLGNYVNYTDAEKEARFGRPNIYNSICSDNLTVEDSLDLNSCHLGTIIRKWTLNYGSGTVSCNQYIEVENTQPFNGGVVDSQPDVDIIWPRDTILTNCSASETEPDKTGRPIYLDGSCSELATSKEADKIFEFADGACFKILRRWIVIDWCQYIKEYSPEDPRQRGYWTHTQIIKVTDFDAPVFTNCEQVTVDAYGANCDEAVNIVVNVDDCTPEESIDFHYEIKDKNNNSVTSGNINSIKRRLGVSGSPYTIYWTASDRCGNTSNCEQKVIVRDRKKPSPYCISEITTVVMPSTGQIGILADRFDLGSTDNCTTRENLRFSFSKDVNETSRIFDCQTTGEQTLDMWITDEAGNQDYCTVTINIQANDACGDLTRVVGNIHTESNEAVEAVNVLLEQMDGGESKASMTSNNGDFKFNISKGSDVRITPKKNDNPLNGVNTLDIVKIQRHIMDIQKFKSPYQIIAADANGDGELKVSDLLTVRKLVLALTDNFEGNTSWRFVSTTKPFANPNNPFPFVEDIEIQDFQNEAIVNDFMAVKVGDVDATATGNVNNTNINSRSASTVVFEMEEKVYQKGELVSIPVRMTNTQSIVGLQMAFDIENLEVLSVESSSISIGANNIAVNNGKLSISWNELDAVTLLKGEELFVIEAIVTGNTVSSQAIAVSNEGMNAEMYSEALQVSNIAVQYRGNDEEAFAVLQNTPNPFSQNTKIGFTLPEAGTATLKIFDITGKVLLKEQGVYEKGHNEVNIAANRIAVDGVMYYQLSYKGQVITKKMIKVGK